MTSAEFTCHLPEPPSPWKRVESWAIGGLLQVGYAKDSDLLLVLSGQGRGIFDCLSGEKLARDRNESDSFDDFNEIKLTASGFDRLAGQTILMAGLWGGGLTRITTDGWFLEERIAIDRTRQIYLLPPHNDAGASATLVGDEGACELRAYGFSQTGLSFIIATSCDLTIFRRSTIETTENHPGTSLFSRRKNLFNSNS